MGMTGSEPSSRIERGAGRQGRSVIRRVLRNPFREAWRAFQYVDGAYLRGHPELELFPTDQLRRQAVRRAVSRFLWRRAFWWAVIKTFAFAVLLGLVLITMTIAVRTLYPFAIGRVLPWSVIPMALVMVAAVFFANRGLSRCMPDLLREELLRCGVPICTSCGYPLADLPGPACPECGTPFNERVREILGRDADSSNEAAADDA